MDTAAPCLPSLSRAASAVRSSAIRDLLALTEQGHVRSLAGGLPALDLVHDPIFATAAAALLDEGPAALQYATTEGDPGLRAWIAASRLGDPTLADGLLVTHGSQQALGLVVQALVDPGAVVVTEDPTYLGAAQILAAAGAEPVAVPIDHDGMDTARLAALLADGLRPALAYLAPTFQNPSGVVMSTERRRHLAELADRYGFVVVDDDPYRELAFEPAPKRLRSFVDPDRSVTLGTFSKVAAPGLRVGWVLPPAWLRPHLVRLKQAADLHTSTFGQRLLAALSGTSPTWFDDRAASLTDRYRARAAVLAGALRAGTDRLVFDEPRGGMFLWATLPEGGPTAEALALPAIDAGVAFVPGTAFTHDGRPTHTLRLCFATLDESTLAEAGTIVAEVVERS